MGRQTSGRALLLLTAHLRVVLPTLSGVAALASDEPLWNAAWISDSQTPDCEWITTLVARVGANRPKLVLHTGDTRFEWADRCAWRSVMTLVRRETPPLEFHLAPGNHDLQNGVLKLHLRLAATRGLYRLDTGRTAAGFGYYHNRVPAEASGPPWPVWNPEVADHPAWQPAANRKPEDWRRPEIPYRYVFKRGGIRFIVCDCFYTDEQRAWLRDLIVRPDDSSVSIVLHHRHEVNDLAKYFEGLEGRHNVRLVLTGDHHNYIREERHGVTFVTAAGLAKGQGGENDAMTLWVYEDRLRLDRYVIPQGFPMRSVEGPRAVWRCQGRFSDYRRPPPKGPPSRAAADRPERPSLSRTLGPNLIYNGDFDNHVWYERFRGWSPAGWYQWFTRGGHAPEHAVGRPPSPPFPAHSGKEFVRIHMWGRAWRGGILQVVRGLQPCRHYRLTAYGCFQPAGAPETNARIGLDPCGGLAEQFAVDVTEHPAPKYDEGVGDDPTTPEVEGPDLPESTVWSAARDLHRWGRFEVAAEARSDRVTVILYCHPKQRPANQPIYEMNWDSVSLVEIPWPTERLVRDSAVLAPDGRVGDIVVTVQRGARSAQVTWGTSIPAGASQVLYRFLDSEAENRERQEAEKSPPQPRSSDFPLASEVQYERAARRHWIAIRDLTIPEGAAAIEAVALSRVLDGGTCLTLCSPPARARLP